MSDRRPQDGGTKLSPQTLIVASLASLTAAIVTSTFWQRGTPITAAITPVIVAIASELYSRPARRITELRSRAAVPRSQRFTQQQVRERERVPSGLPSRSDALRPPEGPELGPMRVYRTEQRSSPIRRVHIRAVLITAAIAFVIAIAVLTLPELVFGGSVAANNSRTTFFGGGTRHHNTKKNTPTTTQNAPTTSTPSATTPTQSAPTATTPPAQTAPQPTTPSQTPPAGGTPAPAPSGTTGP
ncbi:MAG TPA: hypothetical protein VF032_21660 [Thermoleophilaceae bacterium]